MSNHWDLKCRTCDVVHDLDWNHGGDYIQQLIQLLPGLASAPPALDFLINWHPTVYDISVVSGLADFASRHHDHDLIAVDEYGNEHGECGRSYKCRCCEKWPHCRKPTGHDGDCGPTTTEPAADPLPIRWDGGTVQATQIINLILTNGGTARYVGEHEDHMLRRTSEDVAEFIAVDTADGATHRIDVGEYLMRRDGQLAFTVAEARTTAAVRPVDVWNNQPPNG